MSWTFSTNSGSVDNLKVSLRCGCSENAVQIRCTVDGARPRGAGHPTRTPMCAPGGRRLQRRRHHLGNLLVGDGPRRTRARLAPPAVEALLSEASPPSRCCRAGDAEPLLRPVPPRPKSGRPPVPGRAALTGMLFVLRTCIPWEMLPAEMGCGSGVTCRRRLRALVGLL